MGGGGREGRDPQRFWLSVFGALRHTGPGTGLVRAVIRQAGDVASLTSRSPRGQRGLRGSHRGIDVRVIGITGVVRDDHGCVLLRHRLWPPDRQCGFPTGYANKGEWHEDTIAREETGLTVKAGRYESAAASSGLINRFVRIMAGR